jgi:hypothetical protein
VLEKGLRILENRDRSQKREAAGQELCQRGKISPINYRARAFISSLMAAVV